jgi:hypothetical protein
MARPDEPATNLLLPGAGGDSWYWHLVAPRLRDLGHEVLTPDLPAGDDAAGLEEYADVAVEAIGDRGDVIPRAATRTPPPTRRPCSSTTSRPRSWPRHMPAERRASPTVPSPTPGRSTPGRTCRPASKERLAVTPDVIDSGHLVALSRPDDLVHLLESYRGVGTFRE